MFAIPRFRLSLRATVPFVISTAMLLSLMCSLSMSSAQAEKTIASTATVVAPLQVGQAAPHFNVQDMAGQAYSFDPQQLERPALLITFRGGWCPYCNMHLSELHTVIPEIAAMGVDVLFLSGDRPELLFRSLKLETQSAIDGLDYTILSDADAQAAIALGVAFEAGDATIERRRMKGDDIDGSSMEMHGVLPVPAVFAVGMDGVITFVYANADYKVRLPADELLQVAGELLD